MTQGRVHQMTANLVYGDAVTNDVFEIDRRLRAWGLESRVFSDSAEPGLGAVSRPSCEYEQDLARPEDLLIYHYSIYSPNLELYKRSRNRRLVIYHNITPPEFFHGFDPHLESRCRLGRSALSELRDCDFALADSEFNRRELIAVGIAPDRTAVRPVAFDLANLAAVEPNGAIARRVQAAAGVNLLSVGRLAPNKRCEDLLKLVHAYRRAVGPQVHLWLVGNRAFRTYVEFLDRLVKRLNLVEAVSFTDRVSRSDLRAYYEASDIFVSASQHEGFGVPYIECMQFDLPILALAEAATPETLGDAGVLVTRWSLPEVVEAVALLTSNQDLRERIIKRQRRRLAELTGISNEQVLRQTLTRLGAL